jgi:hypothetical protein
VKTRHVVIVACVIAALGGAFWLLSFRRDPGRELSAAAAAFLTRLGDGRVEEAYAQASEELKANMDLGLFKVAAEDLDGALGKFKRFAKVTRSEVKADDQVTRAEFAAEAEFDRRALPIELAMVHREDGWRIARFKFAYPDGFWPEPDKDALLRDSGQLMAWFGAGELEPMYQRLFPSVRDSWTPSGFEADVKQVRDACGTLRTSVPRVVGTNDTKMTLVESAVGCSQGGGFMTQLKWTWLHGKWRLLGVAWVPVEKSVTGAAAAGESAPVKTP